MKMAIGNWPITIGDLVERYDVLDSAYVLGELDETVDRVYHVGGNPVINICQNGIYEPVGVQPADVPRNETCKNLVKNEREIIDNNGDVYRNCRYDELKDYIIEQLIASPIE
jgi:hypothetical protein